MKRLWLSLGTLLALVVLSGPAPSAGAQLRGEIRGVASGPDGPLSGLTVKIINSAGMVVGTAMTSSTGMYSVPGLAVGTYTVQLVDRAGAVLTTGMGTVTATVAAVTVNLTLTTNRLAPAAVTASHTKAIVIGAAVAAGAGTAIYIATRPDSSSTR